MNKKIGRDVVFVCLLGVGDNGDKEVVDSVVVVDNGGNDVDVI